MEDRKRCIANEKLETTGFAYTLSLISGKYKMTILYTLMEFGTVRFNELKRYISSITYKTRCAERVGSGRTCSSRGVSADTAESRVFVDGKGEVAHAYS